MKVRVQWLLVVLLGAVALLWGGWRYAFQSSPPAEGTQAPDLALQDQNGKTHHLSDYKGKYVALMFYPKDFTPGCTAQNCSVRDSFARLAERGVTVLAISTDSVETHARFAETHQLKHTLLSDPDGTVAKQYGVYNPIGFANRVTFIIGPNGNIVKVFPKAGTANHGAELLAFFDEKAPPEKLEIGKKVPDFTLPNVLSDKPNKNVHLYDIKNKKAVVILFIATRCPISNAYNERMVALAKEFQAKGVQFLGINSNSIEPTDEVIQHAKEHGFPFPVLKDEENKIADRYAAQVTPEAFVVDPNFVLRYHGRIDNSMEENQVSKRELRAALEALLAGQPVEVSETKAFGCTIKRVNQ